MHNINPELLIAVIVGFVLGGLVMAMIMMGGRSNVEVVPDSSALDALQAKTTALQKERDALAQTLAARESECETLRDRHVRYRQKVDDYVDACSALLEGLGQSYQVLLTRFRDEDDAEKLPPPAIEPPSHPQ